MSSSKRTNVPPKEWAKHLRPFGKKEFWSSVRNLFRSEEKEEMILEIDPEELKRNKEEYERELRASLNAEPEETANGVQPPQLPIAVTQPSNLSTLDQIKANAETVDIFFPDKEDKPLPLSITIDKRDVSVESKILKSHYDGLEPPRPLPKVVTIEVSGLAGTGKTYLLQMIDDAIQEKLGVVPLCAELEDEARQINVNEISQELIDDYKSGKIIIEMRERTINPVSLI